MVGPTLVFREPRGTPPDPFRTYAHAPELLERALARLEPGKPLVLGHAHDEPLDIVAFTDVLHRVHAAGHDLVMVIDRT